MKIIVVLGRDGYNLSLVNVVKEMINKGHSVDLYGFQLDKNHLYMFEGMNIPIKNVHTLTKNDMEKYDVAFTISSFFEVAPNLMDANIYVFSFNTSFLDEPMLGTDFMFERGAGWRPKLTCGRRAECPYMIVGDPKQDRQGYAEIVEEEKRLLFIDSGHYPFGREGKQAVAQFLINVCKKFPDYQLVIKPRFLKGDKNVTHQNNLFLYDVIEEITNGELPSNLLMLQEHTDLNVEIAKSHTCICMYTTAYIDVAVQGKGLVILDHLPNEETADLRIASTWKPARELMEKSGCLVDYRDAIDYLPEGIKFSEENFKQNVYSYGNVGEKIVNAIEYIWNNFLSKQKYPKLKTFYYDTYLQQMEADEELTMDKIIELRKKNFMYYSERRFYHSTCLEFSDNRVTEYIDKVYQQGTLSEKSMQEVVQIVNDQLLLLEDYIPDNAISQSYLFKIILNSSDITKIFEYPKEKVKCKKFYSFLMGRAYYVTKNYKKAVEAFEEYHTQGRSDFAVDLGDIQNYILSSYFYEGMACMEISNYKLAKKCFEKCEDLTENSHIKAREQLKIIKEQCC